MAALAAVWAYAEAQLALKISEGLSSGIYASLLGFLGIFVASLARLPLLRYLWQHERRRLAMLLSALLALAALPVSSPLAFYLLLSAGFGIASAAAFSYIVHDQRYELWRSSIAALNALSSGLTAAALLLWSQLGAQIAPLLLLLAALSLLLSYLLLPPPLFSGINLRSLEVLSDIVSFRTSPHAYESVMWEAARVAALLGGLGALRVTVLSGAFEEEGALSIASYAAGSLFGALLALLHNASSVAMLLAMPAVGGSLLLPPLLELMLLGAAISYAQTAAITYVLETRPRQVFSAAGLLSLSTGLGAGVTGVLSLAQEDKASLLALLLAAVLTALSFLTYRRRWD
ncbi:MAG: hypothetical protein N3F67_03305 [Acidilobaceae archaeon]|nr:hypothetical protein [Acidilobaceae archaeon]